MSVVESNGDTAKTTKALVLEVDTKVDELQKDVHIIRNALGLNQGQVPISQEMADMKAWRYKVTGVGAASLAAITIIQIWLLVRPFIAGF